VAAGRVRLAAKPANVSQGRTFLVYRQLNAWKRKANGWQLWFPENMETGSCLITGMNRELTTEPPIEAKAPSYVPEFFRLPRTGERDRYFDNSRSQYYAMDKAGDIKLVRLRRRGKKRGTVFVPYDQVAALIREAQNAQHGEIVGTGGEHAGTAEYNPQPKSAPQSQSEGEPS